MTAALERASLDPAAALLKITADRRGELLRLESERIVVPDNLRGLMTGMLGLVGAAGADYLWRPHRVEADRGAGVLTVVELQVLNDQERRDAIRLQDVESAVIRTRYVPPPDGRRTQEFRPDHPRVADLSVVVRDGSAGPRTVVIPLRVFGVDTIASVEDLAARLGAAMGLPGRRVLQRDPRRVAIELARSPDIAQEAPAGGAIGTTTFPGDSRIVEWTPGRMVRFHKPLDRMAIGCFPLGVATLLLGPATWYFLRDNAGSSVAPIAITTLLGLVFGGLAVAYALSCLSTDARIAWTDNAVTVRRALRRRRMPLDAVASFEVRCRRSFYSGGSHGQRARNLYVCSVLAVPRASGSGTAAPLELISTKPIANDPEAPYDAVLPIAQGLATALGVPWTVTDYA